MSDSTQSRKKHVSEPTAERSVVDRARRVIASVIWLLAVTAAMFLAVGALVVALDFNQDNGVVSFITDVAGTLDFGDLKTFDPGKTADSAADAATKSALVNWGIAAIVYLVVGKGLDRLIRP